MVFNSAAPTTVEAGPTFCATPGSSHTASPMTPVIVQHNIGEFKQAFAAGMAAGHALRIAQVGQRDNLHAFGARGECQIYGHRIASGYGMNNQHVARMKIDTFRQYRAIAFQLLHAAVTVTGARLSIISLPKMGLISISPPAR